MKILVLGAGELGMAVLQGLAQRRRARADVQVSVLMRPTTILSPSVAKRADFATLRALGINVLGGDIQEDSISRLGEIFTPFQLVIGCTGFTSGGQIQVKLARAVLEAGVACYIPWQFGLDYDVIGRGSACDIFDEQLDVRDMLRAQDSTHWIIISTGMFTSFLFEPSFGVVDIDKGVVRALGDWNNELVLTTAQDIGMLTAEVVFADSPRILDQVVYVAGDVVSFGGVADIVEEVLNKKMAREQWTVTHLQQDLAEAPADLFKKYRVVFAQGIGVAWDVKTTVNGRKGIPTTSVRQWAQNHLG
ncbi:MAG: hypothetical protein M1817_002379 [Caeruleum heppii]|nr:MAG: hypothetical protein M1817_002379 [Caeruleum heppii]